MNKKTSSILAAAVLFYVAFSKLPEFNILYNGIALIAGISALIVWYMTYKKEK